MRLRWLHTNDITTYLDLVATAAPRDEGLAIPRIPTDETTKRVESASVPDGTMGTTCAAAHVPATVPSTKQHSREVAGRTAGRSLRCQQRVVGGRLQ